MQLAGMEEEDLPHPSCDVWPENWRPLIFFSRMQTQWRVGINGAVGLDYNVIFHELDRKGYKGAEYDEMFECLQIMEAAALKLMSEAK